MCICADSVLFWRCYFITAFIVANVVTSMVMIARNSGKQALKDLDMANKIIKSSIGTSKTFSKQMKFLKKISFANFKKAIRYFFYPYLLACCAKNYDRHNK